tara:strand:- start:117 stop:806 length:690 start_codon:yes stop_codon:yes gene_type:complete
MSVRGAGSGAGSGPGVLRPSSAASARNARSGSTSKVSASVTEYKTNSGNFTITYGNKPPVKATWDKTKGTMTFSDPNNQKRSLQINTTENTATYTNGSGKESTNNSVSLPPIDDELNPAAGLVATSLLSLVGALLASLTTLHALAPPHGVPSTKHQQSTPVRQSVQSTPMAHAGGSRGNASGDRVSNKLQTFVESVLEQSATTLVTGHGDIESDIIHSIAEALGLLGSK